MATAPGWYDDPRPESAAVRWWDGAGWTDWIADEAGSSPPTDAAPARDPAPARELGPAAGSQPGVRTPIAVLLTAVVVVLALVAVGLTVSFTGRRYVQGAPAAPPPASAQDAVSYDRSSQTVSAGELSMTLPGTPWECSSGPKAISPYYAKAMACSVVVHENYDGDQDTYANVVVGLLDPDMTGTDLSTTAIKAFDGFRTNLFKTETTVVDLRTVTALYGSGAQALDVTAQLHYREAKLASRYDEVRLVVVQLRSGAYAAVFLDVADDLSAATKAVLLRATDTLAVTS